MTVRYGDEEFETLKQWLARSTSRTLAGYVRKVSLAQPVGIITRDGSFDAFVDELIELRKTLREVYQKGEWNLANQERLIALHQEIKLIIDKIANLCMPN